MHSQPERASISAALRGRGGAQRGCLRSSDMGPGASSRRGQGPSLFRGREGVLKQLSAASFEKNIQSVSKSSLSLGTSKSRGKQSVPQVFPPHGRRNELILKTCGLLLSFVLFSLHFLVSVPRGVC